VILATGASGKPLMPSIPGLESFRGSRLIHSSEFQGLSSESFDENEGRKVIVIGSSNSAHDIAQDYQEHGYSVTMVQRSSTHVVSSQTLVDVTMAGLYCEGGVSILPCFPLFLIL
jgi:cation diffusion facilitator CzcD-associated flavoprotein CzcO